jgi:hypothetical protein
MLLFGIYLPNFPSRRLPFVLEVCAGCVWADMNKRWSWSDIMLVSCWKSFGYNLWKRFMPFRNRISHVIVLLEVSFRCDLRISLPCPCYSSVYLRFINILNTIGHIYQQMRIIGLKTAHKFYKLVTCFVPRCHPQSLQYKAVQAPIQQSWEYKYKY